MLDSTKSPKPKIAVCLSGQLRTWKIAGPNIKRFFGPDVDYFIHSWTESAERTSIGTHSVDYGVTHDADEINEVVKFFQPTRCQFETILQQEGFVTGRWVNLFYSLDKSMKLKQQFEKEKRFKYDIVVKCRFDLAFHPAFTFSALLNMGRNWEIEPQAAKYVFSSIVNQLPNEGFANQIDDCFFYTSSPVADYVSHNAYLEALQTCADVNLRKKPLAQTRDYGPGAILFKSLSEAGCAPRVIEISNNGAAERITGAWFCIVRATANQPPQISNIQEYAKTVSEHFKYYES